MLHGVGHEARHHVRNVLFVAINGSHQEMVANIVGHGEVPPYVGRTLDEVINPLHAALFGIAFVHVGNHTVACPHDVDATIELGTEGSKVSALHVRPALVVLRRAHDERVHVLLHFHELFVDVVQEFGLSVGIGSFARDVVEEHGKGAHAQVIHLLELAEQVVTVFLIPLDVLARMNGPYEVYGIFLGYLNEFLDLLGFLFRIRQAPVGRAMIRVILWTVDIGVHLVLSVELQMTKTCLMAPRSTIEAFHHATETDFRPVGDFGHGQLSVFHQLSEGLHGIESAPFVISCQDDFFRTDAEEVAFCLGRDEFLIFAYGLVASLADVDFQASVG